MENTTATAERPEYLTVAEVSTLFRVSVPTIYRRVADGQLPHIRIGNDGPIRIPSGELERWLYSIDSAAAFSGSSPPSGSPERRVPTVEGQSITPARSGPEELA